MIRIIVSFKTLLFLLLTISYPASAFAACGLSISASNITINWDLNYATLAVQFTLRKSEVPACNFGIGFTKGGASTYAERRGLKGSATMRYQLYKDNGLSKILQDTPFTSVDQLITGGFQEGANLNQEIVYYLAIPYALATSPTLVAAGNFDDTYAINVYEGSVIGDMVTPATSATISLRITVPSMIDLSIISSGGGFDISQTTKSMTMGNLYQGLASTCDLRVRTNGGYSVTFSSNNNGALKPADTGIASSVPYLFYVNSVLRDMSSSKTIPVVGLSGSGQTDMQGLSYPIRVIIGNMGTTPLFGGTHSDSITITATTTE